MFHRLPTDHLERHGLFNILFELGCADPKNEVAWLFLVGLGKLSLPNIPFKVNCHFLHKLSVSHI